MPPVQAVFPIPRSEAQTFNQTFVPVVESGRVLASEINYPNASWENPPPSSFDQIVITNSSSLTEPYKVLFLTSRDNNWEENLAEVNSELM